MDFKLPTSAALLEPRPIFSIFRISFFRSLVNFTFEETLERDWSADVEEEVESCREAWLLKIKMKNRKNEFFKNHCVLNF